MQIARLWFNFDNERNSTTVSSIIEGFNYDIFISYRQKDNRGERWVSEFVESLKTEIESTFKEEISVYFDINPHDGLLETHDVDESLKEKLKCLIFIPIISRTYCDPKSFAWEHEFKEFVEQASKDRFGLKIKLPGGNVANRVLPIRIYDLDNTDIKLYETILGGVLRGVEFIYRSTGVNRPLRSKEDNPNDNLNRTFYRDQINKTANSIKEIIQGLNIEQTQPVKEKIQPGEFTQEEVETERKSNGNKSVRADKRKFLIPVSAIVLLLIIAGIITLPKVFRRNALERMRSSGKEISVVVMPFQNMTNDTIWNVWQDGIQSNIITFLSNTPEELKVRQTESISNILQSKGFTNYASITPLVASAVSKKLNADIYITGNINQSGSVIRLNANLVDSESRDVLKSFQIDGATGKILPLIDTLSVIIRNFILISKLNEELTAASGHELSTGSPEAFRYFMYGTNEFKKNNYQAARNWYFQALSIDSNYFDALTAVSLSYGNEFLVGQVLKIESNETLFEQARKYCIKVYEKRDQLSVKEKIYANWIYSLFFESPNEEIMYLKQLLDLDDQNPKTHYNLGYCNFRLQQYDQAIHEYEKALEIYSNWRVKPNWILNYTYLGESYRKTGQFREAKKLYRRAWRDFHGNPSLVMNMAVLFLSSGNAKLSNRLVEAGISYMKSVSMPESSIAAILAYGYSESGKTETAERYYRQALSTDPENSFRINDLAYFLIDKDINVEEGLMLIDKALDMRPGYYLYLHTKGYGLYKQGKYQDAKEILQKSWDLRRSYAFYDNEAFLHLEAAKKMLAGQMKN